MSNINIMNVNDVLDMKLCIPPYQRPYKWSVKSIEDLLNDISNSISEHEKYNGRYKYRIGTIILQKTDDNFEIVDGQQRIISLLLIKLCLDSNFRCNISDTKFNSKVSQLNIQTNYAYIKEWFSMKQNIVSDFNKAFSTILEVVKIEVDNVSEAFQLFDSQNTRGKPLDPHDLLKAYHLREMKKYPYEMEHAVTKWESKSTNQIRKLFYYYLFPIWNWSRGLKSKPFTADEIDTYKGVSESSNYTYAKRINKSMPCFQIAEPFVSGNDFFEMVDHYLLLLTDAKSEIARNCSFKDIYDIIKENAKSNTLDDDRDETNYALGLFYCVLLYYYDKFHNFDEMAIRKLFIWSMMIRVDMIHLGYDTINKYAIGDENTKYTNQIALFSKINNARLHTEISGLHIKVLRGNDSAAANKWNGLYKQLKKLSGLEEN